MKARGERLIESIRIDILEGRWAPGTKLLPDEMAVSYDTSKTVVREALTGLTGMGLVTVHPNRGFFVQDLSLRELGVLNELRCHTEEIAVRASIENGSDDWEAGVAAAYYQLQRAHRRSTGQVPGLDPEWARFHRLFHAKLIEACEVPALLSVARQLADATELYRRWSARSTAESERDVEGEHRAIFEAVTGRDAPLASALLRQHYQTTVDVLVRVGARTATQELVDQITDSTEAAADSADKTGSVENIERPIT